MKFCIFLILFIYFISCNSVYNVVREQERFILNDQNNDKFYLVELINKNVKLNKIGLVPTVILFSNGEQKIVRSDKEYEGAINLIKKDIKKIEIIPIEKSVKLYGSAGKNGVINIYTF